jgi:hypothetical protein
MVCVLLDAGQRGNRVPSIYLTQSHDLIRDRPKLNVGARWEPTGKLAPPSQLPRPDSYSSAEENP